jgi:hypothetical protein
MMMMIRKGRRLVVCKMGLGGLLKTAQKAQNNCKH